MGHSPTSRLEQKAMFAKLNSGQINGIKSSDLVDSEELNSLPSREKLVNIGIIKNHIKSINEKAKHNKKIKEAEKEATEKQKKVDQEKIAKNKEEIKKLENEIVDISKGKAHHDPYMEALLESKKIKTLPKPMSTKEEIELRNEKNKNKTSKEKEKENEIIVNITNEPVERRDALGNSTQKSKSKPKEKTTSQPTANKENNKPSQQPQASKPIIEDNEPERPQSSSISQKSKSSGASNYDDAISASLGDLT